jgi:hypothetical protein
MMEEKSLEASIKNLVAKHAFCETESLTPETRLGEDLRIIGDDAEEFLKEFAVSFSVNMSSMVFGDYFPDEATPSMHYYLTSIARPKKRSVFSRLVGLFESKFWALFAGKKRFKTVTIFDLVSAAKEGRW